MSSGDETIPVGALMMIMMVDGDNDDDDDDDDCSWSCVVYMTVKSV